MSECFEEWFPYYLSIGMTYDQYWNQDGMLVRAYRKADEIRQERANTDAWLLGAYFYQAMGCVAPMLAFGSRNPKAEPYLEKPFDLRPRRDTENEQELEAKVDESCEMFIAMFMKPINKNLKKKGEMANG